MEYTYPDYYKEFVCTGSACKDNCCAAGWQIAIDEESLDMYKNMEGDIGVRIRNSIDWKTGLFEQYEHKCALLNENGLCDVYCDAGEDKMCVLCQRYPRHYEEYENLREISLSISCPEAARIVLTRKEKTGFYTEEDETEEEYEDFDYLMFTKLVEIREFLFKTVQDRSMPLKYRMAVVLKAVHDIQNLINKDEIFEIDELLDKFNQPDYTKRVIKSLKVYGDKAINRKEYLAAMMGRLHKLEVLKSDWTAFVEECERILYSEATAEKYLDKCREFDEYYAEHEYEYEQILVYFIFTYFCGAVYDYDAESKLKFGLVSVLLIREFDRAVWIKNGGTLSLEDQIEIVHRFSKEVEHSDLNLDDMEKMMDKDGVFGLRKMLTAIVS